mmetsp:Transcript_76395/g.184878  ORF Transcript_76395/g.184878 Transcript_76395/m.184878 type:complete len:281 (+) Transcript_76395:82-924(+)
MQRSAGASEAFECERQRARQACACHSVRSQVRRHHGAVCDLKTCGLFGFTGVCHQQAASCGGLGLGLRVGCRIVAQNFALRILARPLRFFRVLPASGWPTSVPVSVAASAVTDVTVEARKHCSWSSSCLREAVRIGSCTAASTGGASAEASLSFQRRQFASTDVSMGEAPGARRASSPKSGRTTASKNPACVAEAPGLHRSIKKVTGSPAPFSLSPWRKNSSSRQRTHCKCNSHSSARWPKSEHFMANCRSVTASLPHVGARATGFTLASEAWQQVLSTS